ncbi:MAG: cell division protein DivIVA [Rothia sp. (in: high G+C Gram-positive bacteria)]|nr:cell division protein DivIVA [Rothia sp. (in: high G+C Gram-positive bacteria)]
MAQQTASASKFRRATGKQPGYRVRQVNRFFTALADDYELLLSGNEYSPVAHTSRTIREAAFEPEAGGYLPEDVDRALDAVEDRFAEAERRLYIQRYGDAVWQEAVKELRTLLLGRLERPSGERFRRPGHRLTKGYLAKDVDQLCDRLQVAITQGSTVLPGELRRVVFRSAIGRGSYDETQVDAFMNRAIEYLTDTL